MLRFSGGTLQLKDMLRYGAGETGRYAYRSFSTGSARVRQSFGGDVEDKRSQGVNVPCWTCPLDVMFPIVVLGKSRYFQVDALEFASGCL